MHIHNAYADDLTVRLIKLPTISTVTLEIPGELEIQQGNTQSLSMEAEPKVISKISTRIIGNNLRIYSTDSFSTNKPINLKLVISTLNEVNSRSSSDIQIIKLKTSRLKLQVISSGSISATSITANHVSASITGSGDITLGGSTTNLDASIDGSGNIDASDLNISSAKAQIDGAGDILLPSLSRLIGTINGSGTISYQGNPKIVSSVNGSGEIIQQ